MTWNGLPFTMWQSVPFGDKDAFTDWLLHHYLHHQALGVTTKTGIITLDDLRYQLGPHARMHQDVALALNQPPPRTLEDYDLTNRDQFQDFMASHAQIHATLNGAAAL